MKPVRMTKISVTGPRSKLRTVIDTLYEMNVLDIDDYQDEELETGNPFEEAEDISETLVDVRSLISKLPEQEETDENFDLENIQDTVEELKEKVDRIEDEKNNVESRLSNLKNKSKFFKDLDGVNLSYSDLEGTDTLDVFIGKIDAVDLENESGSDRYEFFQGRNLSVVVYDSDDEEVEDSIFEAAKDQATLPEVDVDGTISEVADEMESRRKDAKRSLETLEGQLEDISKGWYGRLEAVEDYLTERVEKAEAPINFASTEKTFIAEGWIPQDRYEEVEEALCDAAEGKIHIQREEGEDPPVKHDNPGPVKSFESLTDLMAVPSYNELDPSFVIMLTFPLMFGFMIGDAGYGLTSFLVFYGGYRMFPKGKEIFKSLMWASGFTFLFGLYFSEVFGYVYDFFGEKSQLAAMTGIDLFRQIPVFHKGGHYEYTLFGLTPEMNSWTAIFVVSALIGVLHVNFGYLLGFYNEITNHGFIEAFLEKGSWIMLELSAAAFILSGPAVGGALALVSVALLYKGEGIEGIVEIPSLLSNILSYLRLFGVAVAAFSLAKVVNALADPLFQMGGVTGIVLGVFMLVFGHTFNTFIKIMEGFLQGIRLHYVEMFSKFYEGGGRKYLPFGTREIS